MSSLIISNIFIYVLLLLVSVIAVHSFQVDSRYFARDRTTKYYNNVHVHTCSQCIAAAEAVAARRPTAATTRRSFKHSLLSASSSTTTEKKTADDNEAMSSIHHVTFEYCTGCKWMTRSLWMAQELLTTFNDENLSAVSIIPSRPPPGARFIVTHHHQQQLGTTDSDDESTTTSTILWDREKKDGFPDVKELKQLVRDKINSELYLGHSDNKHEQYLSDSDSTKPEKEPTMPSVVAVLDKVLGQLKQQQQPHIAIQYCTGCRWMLRSAYFVTELLSTFKDEINSATLIPSRPPEKGGIFRVTVNGRIVWDRAEQGGFPETKELKRLIRDILVPSKNLGHIDDNRLPDDGTPDNDDMDEEEAEKWRAFMESNKASLQLL